jgi:hypothetical protein
MSESKDCARTSAAPSPLARKRQRKHDGGGFGGTQNTASVIRFRSIDIAPEAKALCAGLSRQVTFHRKVCFNEA